MRLTGQATTAIGNVIVNMLTLCEFVNDNKSSINYMLFLGDDSLLALNNEIDISKLENHIRDNFNMQSKAALKKHQGTFC